MRSIFTTGTAGEKVGYYQRIAPRGPRIIYCHGSGSSAAAISTDSDEIRALREITSVGEVVAADLGGETWGNDTAVARIRSYAGSDPVILVGISMGACNALNYARAYPSDVLGVAGIIPLVDLVAARSFAAAGIDAAYPVGDYAEHSPVTFADELDADLPITLFTSSNDTFTPPSTAEAFVTARPQTGLVSLGAIGHGSWASAFALGPLLPYLRSL